MNVFGGSQASEAKRIILKLDDAIKSHTFELEKFERLLSENIKNIKIQEEKIKALQISCVDNKNNIEKNLQETSTSSQQLNKIISAIISRLNTIETYYKDKS